MTRTRRLLLAWLVGLLGGLLKGCDGSNHRRLRDYLMFNYGDVHIRPVKETTTTTYVTVRPIFNNLIEMNTRDQDFTIDCWLKLTWTDEFLMWNASEFNGTKKIYLPAESAWLPDITLSENVDLGFQRFKYGTLLEVYDNGLVKWFVPTMFVSGCSIRVTWYPYDIQICDLTFGSFAYTGHEVVFAPEYSNDSKQNRYLENGVWDFADVNMKQLTTMYTCCNVPFYEAQYRLIFRRQPDFYISYLIMPVFVLSVLSLLVFYLPPECGEKLTLSITNLLALVVFQQIIAENIPPSGIESPIVGRYFISMITMVSLSVVATVIAIHTSAISHRPTPKWVNWLFLQKLPRFLCLDNIKITTVHRRHKSNTSSQVNNGLEHELCDVKNTFHILNAYSIDNNEEQSDHSLTKDTDGSSSEEEQVNHNSLQWKSVSLVLDRCFLVLFSTFACVFTGSIFALIVLGSNSEYKHEVAKMNDEWKYDTLRVL